MSQLCSSLRVFGTFAFAVALIAGHGSVAAYGAGTNAPTVHDSSAGGQLGYDLVSELPTLGVDVRLGFGSEGTTAFVLNSALSTYLGFIEQRAYDGSVSARTDAIHQFDLNGLIRLEAMGSLFGYSGLGLGLIHWSTMDFGREFSTVSVAVNAIFGVELALDAPVMPYAQVRVSYLPFHLIDYGSSTTISLQAGANFVFGR